MHPRLLRKTFGWLVAHASSLSGNIYSAIMVSFSSCTVNLAQDTVAATFVMIRRFNGGFSMLLFTDKDLQRVFLPAYLKRGRDYQAFGRVKKLAIDADGRRIGAAVQGGAKRP